MALDVFVRSCPLNDLRLYLAMATIVRWPEIKGIRPADNYHLILADCKMRGVVQDFWSSRFPSARCYVLPMARFWTTSKRLAEDEASGPLYVLADDDHLPVEPASTWPNWLAVGTGLWGQYQGFGLVSAMPTTQENPGPVEFEDVGGYGLRIVRVGCVGAPYFARKGALMDLPDSPIERQDAVMCDHLGSRGYLVGQCAGVRYNHTGIYLTTARPDLAVGV